MAKQRTLIVTGDINLMAVTDPAIPFAKIGSTLRRADAVLSNLECCFYDPPDGRHAQEAPDGLGSRSGLREGFYAPTHMIAALHDAGIKAVGNANNCNYGDAAIESSLAILKSAGIPSSGAGLNKAAAFKPAVIDVDGLKVGLIQRTCVYWPNNHEASKTRPGVAALKVHTAYSPRVDEYAASRPGTPPTVHTFVDPDYKAEFIKQVKALKKVCDVAVVSIHWGYKLEVLDYMTELAHAAIDNGADLVMGHGPHHCLPVEVYKGAPIYYGLSSFSFDHGHRGRRHGDWLGMYGKLTLTGKKFTKASFSFVRHSAKNETYQTPIKKEQKELEHLRAFSEPFGTELKVRGDQVVFLDKK